MQRNHFLVLPRRVETEPLSLSRLHDCVVVELDKYKVVQSAQVIHVSLVDGELVVDVGQELTALFVHVLVERVVPVRCLDKRVLHPAEK